jgi:hypothetical protein
MVKNNFNSSSAPLHLSTQREASTLEDRVRSMHLLIKHQVTVAIIGVRETSFDVIKKSVDKKGSICILQESIEPSQ